MSDAETPKVRLRRGGKNGDRSADEWLDLDDGELRWRSDDRLR